MLTQNLHGERMKRGQLHALTTLRNKSVDALTHLGGCLVGERNSEHPKARVGGFSDETGDSICENTSLPRARARYH
jgi:hypothetical protein